MSLYTSKAVAEWLGITDRRVRELRDEGILTEARPGLYNMKTAVRQYLRYKLGDGDDMARLTAARADREKTRCEIEQMRLAEAKGDLHRTEDIERALKVMISNFRTRILEIPTKYAGTLAQTEDRTEVFDLLNKATSEALEELSNFDVAMAAEPDEEEDEPEE